MSAGGIIADTMANLKTVKDASGKEYTYKQSTMTGELFVRNLVRAYIKSPEKYVLKEWSADNGGRKTPLKTDSQFIVWLNKGQPEGFNNSQYQPGLHYRVFENSTRFIYRNKTDDWKTDLIQATKDAEIFPISKEEKEVKEKLQKRQDDRYKFMEMRRLLSMGLRNIGYGLYFGKVYSLIFTKNDLLTVGEYLGKTKIVIPKTTFEKLEPDEDYEEIFSKAPIHFKSGITEMLILKDKVSIDINYKDPKSDEVANAVKSLGQYLKKIDYDEIDKIVRDRVHNPWKFNSDTEKVLKLIDS